MAGFVLTRQAPAGRWGATTYALKSTDEGDGHRGHKGHGTDNPQRAHPDAPYAPYAFGARSTNFAGEDRYSALEDKDMSAAAEALQLARQCGVRVKADGGDLILAAASPPPATVLDALKHYKPEIVSLLAVSDDPQIAATAIFAWDVETAELIAWFLRTSPPTNPFELCSGVTILRPAQFWRDLKADIARGPERAPGITGALQDDLRKLPRLFGSHAPKAEDAADGE